MLAAGSAVWSTAAAPHRLPDGRMGEPYEYGVAFEGFTEPIRFRWSAPLPAGLKTEKSLLFGTPQVWTRSPVPIALELTDALGESARRDFTLLIRPPLQRLRIVTNNPPVFVLGEPVDYEFTATGGEGLCTWDVIEVLLPAGLQVALDEPKTKCRIAGTASAVGDIRVRVLVSDATQTNGPALIRGSVGPAIAPPLGILSATLPPAFYRMPYSQTLIATGGVPPYQWSAQTSSATFSNWLAFGPASGMIMGTPLRIETVRMNVAVTDSLGSKATRQGIELRVEPPVGHSAFALQPSELPIALVGQPYAAGLAPVNHRGYVAWQVADPPPWLKIKTDADRLRLTGQPDRPGSWSLSIQAQDMDLPASAGTLKAHVFGSIPAQRFSIQAIEQKPKPQPLRMLSETLPVAIHGVPYRVHLAATGGEGPITFHGDTRNASWLTLSPSGQLSGTPLQVGEGEILVQVKDSRGAESPMRKWTINVVAAAKDPFRILDFAPPVALVGHAFSFQIPTVGGLLPYDVKIAGDLPPGLQLDARAPRIFGTPARAGRFPINITARDSTPNASLHQRDLLLEVLSEQSIIYPDWPWIVLGLGGIVLGTVGFTIALRSKRKSQA